MEKQLWEILVPTVRPFNPKFPFARYFSTRYHRVWDANVRQICGGLTVMPPSIAGEWVSPVGELFRERMIPVRILCTEQQIEQIADMTAVYYSQEAIMFYRISDKVVVKEYEKTAVQESKA